MFSVRLHLILVPTLVLFLTLSCSEKALDSSSVHLVARGEIEGDWPFRTNEFHFSCRKGWVRVTVDGEHYSVLDGSNVEPTFLPPNVKSSFVGKPVSEKLIAETFHRLGEVENRNGEVSKESIQIWKELLTNFSPFYALLLETCEDEGGPTKE